MELLGGYAAVDDEPQAKKAKSSRSELEELLPAQAPPPYACGAGVQAAIEQGRAIKGAIEERSDFKNPELMSWLVNAVGVEQGGTNHPQGKRKMKLEEQWENLSKRQEELHANQQREREKPPPQQQQQPTKKHKKKKNKKHRK